MTREISAAPDRQNHHLVLTGVCFGLLFAKSERSGRSAADVLPEWRHALRMDLHAPQLPADVGADASGSQRPSSPDRGGRGSFDERLVSTALRTNPTARVRQSFHLGPIDQLHHTGDPLTTLEIEPMGELGRESPFDQDRSVLGMDVDRIVVGNVAKLQEEPDTVLQVRVGWPKPHLIVDR